MSRSFKFNKLVRTGKFREMCDQGQDVHHRNVEGHELRAALGAKIEKIVLDDNDPWVSYYASQPDRFPEITGE